MKTGREIDAQLEADVVALTVENGGGTFEARTLLPFAPGTGYAVGMARGTAALQDDAGALGDTVRRVGQEWNASLVGTWLGDDGRVHVDPVQYIIDRDTAVRLGRERHQEAIYGFAEGVIPLEA